MNRKLTNLITLVLACLGGLDALALTVKHFLPGTPLGCSLGPSGCEGVLKGAYSHVGPIPTALFGVGMYAALIFLTLKRKREIEAVEARNRQAASDYASRAENESEAAAPALPVDRTQLRLLDTAVFALAALGACVSLWLQYTSLFVLLSFCPYCFFSACMVSSIALIAARDYFLADRRLNGEQKLILGVAVGVGFLALLLYLPTVLEQYQQTQRGVTPFTPYTTRELLVPATLNVKGDPKAPVLIVEFADYQCSHCKDANETLLGFLKEHPEKIKIAFRNFPLQMHQWASEASQACEAAGLQGKFWEYHDLVFQNQSMLTSPDFTPNMFQEFARQLGLDEKKFSADKSSKPIADKVNTDLSTGRQNQVDTTPTFFFITPKKIWRAVGKTELLSVLDDPKHDVWKAAGLVSSPAKP